MIDSPALPTKMPRPALPRLGLIMLPALLLIASLLAPLAQAAASAPDTVMTSAQCVRCHVAEPLQTHPNTVRPSMPVPAYLPLENGLVTCTTCHDNSAKAHAQNRLLPTPGSLLRGVGEEGTLFCVQCHSSQGLTRRAMHPVGLERAHLAWKRPARGTGNIQPGGTPSVTRAQLLARDHDLGRSCMGCHDGTVASDATGSEPGGPFRGRTAGHPSNVPYNDGLNGRASHRGDMGLRPAYSLDPRVQLSGDSGDMVSCTSCHSPYSQEENLLVMSNANSALCFSCHTNN